MSAKKRHVYKKMSNAQAATVGDGRSLHDAQARIYQCVAILDLAAQLLNDTPAPTKDHLDLVMGAIEASLRILQPVTWLEDFDRAK